MKYKELFKLEDAISSCDEFGGYKFALELERNRRILVDILDPIRKTAETKGKMKEYENKIKKIAVEYAKENPDKVKEKGTKNESVDLYEISDQLLEIENEYKDTLEQHNKNQDEFSEVLESEVPNEWLKKFKKIPDEIMPENIKVSQVRSLSILINI